MIDSTRSATVRRIAALHQRKARSETGLFLLEVPQALREAHEYAADDVFEAYFTTDALARHPELAEAAVAAGVTPALVSDPALAAMADTVTPQGVVAVARQSPAALRDVFDGVRLAVILDEVRDPGNAGTIIRAADAAGAEAVVLTGTAVDPYNPKVVRSTTGSLFHLRVTTGVTLGAALQAARESGLAVFAGDMDGDPVPALGDALRQPTAWLFGNEARGLSAEARALADRTVAVPIYGAAESLNVAVAASVCLYASAFAQRA